LANYAGFEVVEEPVDKFWGDRVGRVRDPFGHIWTVRLQTLLSSYFKDCHIKPALKALKMLLARLV
jgi:hypothetical protein